MSKLEKAAKKIVNDCLGLKEDETALVITDRPLREIGRTIYAAAAEPAEEAILTEITPRANHGVEPPDSVSELMQQVDVVIMPTSKSLSHTQARKTANDAGARAASLPTITEEIMGRTLAADYQAIKQRSEKLAGILKEGNTARLSSEAGTDLELSIAGRGAHPDTGIYHQPGDFGNLPAGEAYIAPVEETAEGKVVIDGSMGGLGVLNSPLTLIVEAGYAVDIQGGEEAEKLTELIEEYGGKARNIAELGIGTNDRAKLTGNVLEDEKVMNTVHLAIGDNSSFGGKVSVESHLDGIIKQPTLRIDDRVIMEKGEFEIL